MPVWRAVGSGKNRTMGAVWEKRMGKGEAARERILEIAEAAVLAKGFAAPSMEDMLSCIVDGAIMSKTLSDPSRIERQIMIFRTCVKLMFAPVT